MIRLQRRRFPDSSESSDDGSQQSRKEFRSFSHSQSKQAKLNSGSIIAPRKQIKKLSASSSGDSSSSGNEEIHHPIRRGSLRALSDYETGDSSDRAVGSTSGLVRQESDICLLTGIVERNEDSDSSNESIIRPRSLRVHEIESDSSDSGMPVGFFRRKKRMRLQSSSDESDTRTHTEDFSTSIMSRERSPELQQIRISGRHRPNNGSSVRELRRMHETRRNSTNSQNSSVRPQTMQGRYRNNSSSGNQITHQLSRQVRSRNRNSQISAATFSRIHDQGRNDNHEASVTPQTRRQLRNRNLDDNRNRPGTHQTRRQHRTRNLANNHDGPVTHQTRRHHMTRNLETRSTQNNILSNSSRTRRVSASQNVHEVSSDSDISDIIPRLLRPRILPVFQSDHTSSTSSESIDSEETFPIRILRRRGANIPLDESNDENNISHDSSKIRTMQNQTFKPSKTIPENSSDSDGESEKCPICLVRFNLQEVGSPSTCDHLFCLVCIQEWAKNNNTCPVDRQQFNIIIVRAEIRGKVIREIPIETPPVRNLWDSDEWWHDLTLSVFASEETSSSLFDSDSGDEYYDGPDEVCCVCFQGNNNDDDMIICDFCNTVYHMNCLDPPLQDLPANAWFCPNCVDAMG